MFSRSADFFCFRKCCLDFLGISAAAARAGFSYVLLACCSCGHSSWNGMSTEQRARHGKDQQDVFGGYGVGHGDGAVCWIVPRQVWYSSTVSVHYFLETFLVVLSMVDCSPASTHRQRQQVGVVRHKQGQRLVFKGELASWRSAGSCFSSLLFSKLSVLYFAAAIFEASPFISSHMLEHCCHALLSHQQSLAPYRIRRCIDESSSVALLLM